MTGFLIRLPFAAARDLATWLLEPACHWANTTHFPLDEKDTDQ